MISIQSLLTIFTNNGAFKQFKHRYSYNWTVF